MSTASIAITVLRISAAAEFVNLLFSTFNANLVGFRVGFYDSSFLL
jgi:hypothetical protein